MLHPASSTLSAPPRHPLALAQRLGCPTGIVNLTRVDIRLSIRYKGSSLGRIRALGKIQCIMIPRIFPEAPILPDLSVVDRTTARSYTISPMSSPQGVASEVSVRITRAHDFQRAR